MLTNVLYNGIVVKDPKAEKLEVQTRYSVTEETNGYAVFRSTEETPEILRWFNNEPGARDRAINWCVNQAIIDQNNVVTQNLNQEKQEEKTDESQS